MDARGVRACAAACMLAVCGAISAGAPVLKANQRMHLQTSAVRMAAATEEVAEKPLATAAAIAGTSASRTISKFAETLVGTDDAEDEARAGQVDLALKRMSRDMQLLDTVAGSKTQLTNVELAVLSGTVLLAFGAPLLLTEQLVEVLVPSMSALSAAVGLSAEYVGKTAVARGKEVAATSLQAAAESEILLAQAERAKAIIPLCLGIGTTASAFALLAPTLLGELSTGLGVQFVTEIYLICPVVAVLGAAIAALATQETSSLTSRAISLGTRRFSSNEDVSRTWLSATEQINAASKRTQEKWGFFVLGVLPAPAIAALFPGGLGFKAIVAAAAAAAQTAYYLSRAEYELSRAVDSVAVKTRAAAVADTYANQGQRAGSILPFTSALSGLCAAVTVAVVEVIPFLNGPLTQALGCVAFPAIGALVAAAASVSKARCEVDCQAAVAAANELSKSDDRERTGSVDPIRVTFDLVKLTLRPVNLSNLKSVMMKGAKGVIDKILEILGLGPRPLPA